jgi:hypothetical protein
VRLATPTLPCRGRIDGRQAGGVGLGRRTTPALVLERLRFSRDAP